MPEIARDTVLRYLREHHVMTIATYGPAGPWAAAVFYANEGFALWFLSSPSSRHCTNMSKQPRVSATIQRDYADWPEIRGIQLEGTAGEVCGEERERARGLYAAKYPAVGDLAHAPAALVEAMAKVRWYKIVPDRLYLIDNSVGFGHRTEIDLTGR